MSAQRWLDRMWYGGALPPWWLMPLTAVFWSASTLRRAAYARGFLRSRGPSCPVIVVGNLTVGGTGKTPLVCWLVARLSDRGYRPGVVSRGYRGTSRGSRRVSCVDDPRVVGDESVLIARRTGAPVAIGRDRPAAADLLAQLGCDVIVSDDGLQHYALARDCEIVVLDGARGVGNGWVLPAGPLREMPDRLQTVDAVVVNGGEPGRDHAHHMRLEADCAVPVIGGASRLLSDFAGESVHAVAGIGNPQRFFKMLRAHGIDVIPRPLDDHAPLRRADIEFADDKSVLMTEKDAVKCGAFADSRHWYVPVTAGFSGDESTSLLDIVFKAIDMRGQAPRGPLNG
ncbi:MAG: tetraacyldisaccharide 4'-kinase [Pseudomonadota bacterium]|nr:tetraacyldisaccharide 4'-kinase [Pseudomonadota bacterium]